MANIVGMTEPYRAANGHTMAAPLIVGKYAEPGVKGRPVSAWAQCVDTCSACAGGDQKEWFAGEEW